MKPVRTMIALCILPIVATACAITGPALGPTPEAQIVNGANAVAAAATVGTTLLKNDKITVAQAKSYRAILGSASEHLNTAAATLADCRKRTSSAPNVTPDPCAATVAGDIALGLSIAAEVHRTLTAK